MSNLHVYVDVMICHDFMTILSFNMCMHPFFVVCRAEKRFNAVQQSGTEGMWGGGGLCGVCVWGKWGIGSDFGIRGRVSPENGWVFKLLSHSEGFMQVS